MDLIQPALRWQHRAQERECDALRQLCRVSTKIVLDDWQTILLHAGWDGWIHPTTEFLAAESPRHVLQPIIERGPGLLTWAQLMGCVRPDRRWTRSSRGRPSNVEVEALRTLLSVSFVIKEDAAGDDANAWQSVLNRTGWDMRIHSASAFFVPPVPDDAVIDNAGFWEKLMALIALPWKSNERAILPFEIEALRELCLRQAQLTVVNDAAIQQVASTTTAAASPPGGS